MVYTHFFIRIPNGLLRPNIRKKFYVKPKIILRLFLSNENVMPPVNLCEKFKSFLICYFIIITKPEQSRAVDVIFAI